MQDKLVATVQLKPPLRFAPVWQIIRHVWGGEMIDRVSNRWSRSSPRSSITASFSRT